MSAIAVAVLDGAEGAAASVLRGAFGAMARAGTESEHRAARTGDANIALGAADHAWERSLRACPGRSHAHGSLIVVADSTLYHRAGLARALALADEGARSDAELIARTYEAWGTGGFAHLEGDFAFAIWDAARARVVAARSFAGHRTLFFARAGTGLRLATTVAGVLSDRSIPRDLDLAAVAAAAGGLWNHTSRTAYSAIDELPTGHCLTWERGRDVRIAPFWIPSDEILTRREPLDAAAEELRALLVDAVRERLAPSGATALSLSGGWDSTAVGGAARLALGDACRTRLRPSSISYPLGDPGREDELIRDVVAKWGIDTRWIDVDGIALLPESSPASERELPFAHAFEHWNRALARAARQDNARVMLDGVGGDQLFQVSDILLSDLFGRMQWIELARQWHARGGTGLVNLWRWAVRPALPPAIPRLVARVLGRPAPHHHLHRTAARWVRSDFLRTSGALARDEAAAPSLPTHSRVLSETHAYLRYPFFGRILGSLRGFALDEGVELRSPLLDDRVVRFAIRRPWSERSDGRETKILLRRAMRGVLPAHVLAPRPSRTGITSAYFLRQLRGPARPVLEAALQDPLLATLGIVDTRRLRHAWDHMLQHDDDDTGARLFFTLQAELWTRAHIGGAVTA